MAHVTLPITSRASSDPNNFADVVGNDNALKDAINGGLDNSNISASAAIAHSKLASSTAGHLLLANASGVITGTAVTGDVTISSSGVTSIAPGAVGTAELGTITGLADSTLASPNNSVYRTLLTGATQIGLDAVAATIILGASAIRNFSPSSNWATTGNGAIPSAYYFDDADYTVASKTQKLRVRAQIWTNGTAPGITFTTGLYPVTVSGAAGVLTLTPGTVVSGSTVATASPSANSITQGNSGDLTIPSDGAYILCCVTSGTIATNSAVIVAAQLQTRHV